MARPNAARVASRYLVASPATRYPMFPLEQPAFLRPEPPQARAIKSLTDKPFHTPYESRSGQPDLRWGAPHHTMREAIKRAQANIAKYQVGTHGGGFGTIVAMAYWDRGDVTFYRAVWNAGYSTS